MFGYLRFFLAFLVMLSHIGIKFYGLNPGVIAVVFFYILAGFVVSHIYIDIIPNRPNRLLLFYKDRLLRIFPLYLYVIIITSVFLLYTSFGNPNFSSITLINNITIIPLNFYMYIDSTILKSTTPPWNLIPPAWSLACELQAYLLLPFILNSKKIRTILVTFSFAIYLIANLSIINPDYFGYRFILGVFFIFAIGASLQQKQLRYPAFIWLTILFITPLFYLTDSFSPTYTKETFIGLLVGVPVVYTFSKSKIKLPLNSLFGSLSYGLFLTHFLSIWILQYLHYTANNLYIYILLVALISLIFSFFGVKIVEKQVIRTIKR